MTADKLKNLQTTTKIHTTIVQTNITSTNNFKKKASKVVKIISGNV